jgi:hypothetical protein
VTHKHYTAFSLSTDLSAEQSTSLVVERVLSCRECRRTLRTLSRWLEALDHFEPLVAPEFATRYEFFNRLFFDHETYEEKIAAITDDEIYHHWGLACLLIEEAQQKILTDPGAAHEFATLALEIGRLLDPAFYHPAWIADLCAQAAAVLAEAHLAKGELETARKSLHNAADWQGLGTKRPRVRRRIATLRARILRAQGWTDEALGRLLQDLGDSDDNQGRHPGNLLSWFLGQWESDEWQDFLQHDGSEAA